MRSDAAGPTTAISTSLTKGSDPSTAQFPASALSLAAFRRATLIARGKGPAQLNRLGS